jgi:hypothetical protein
MNATSKNNKVYFFTLNKAYFQCQPLYSGALASAVLVAENGKKVSVPAVRLRQFIDNRGLVGRFRLIVSNHNKIISFERIR